MIFQLLFNNSQPILTSTLPEDNYKKYLDKFLVEFYPLIKDQKKFTGIVTPLLGSKSWRLLNRELRKACDQYCQDNGIMEHAKFQDKWFYEGTMLGRTTYGANAPWANNFLAKDAPTKNIQTKASKNKAEKKSQKFVWDMNIEWHRINRPIFMALDTMPEE